MLAQSRNREGTPGVVRRGLVWDRHRFRVDRFVEIFCKDHLGLFCLFVKNIVGHRLAFVKQGNTLFGIHANSNERVSHCIGGTLGLNLINHIFKLQC